MMGSGIAQRLAAAVAAIGIPAALVAHGETQTQLMSPPAQRISHLVRRGRTKGQHNPAGTKLAKKAARGQLGMGKPR